MEQETKPFGRPPRPHARLPELMQSFEARLEELAYCVPSNTVEENVKAFKELGDKYFQRIFTVMEEIKNYD